MAAGSFSAGLTGLNAFSSWLSVIGNNLANLNTVGFKGSTVAFQDLVSQSVSGNSLNPMQVGLGVTMGSVAPTFNQGAIEATGESTNVAIQGGGFFVVANNAGLSYTRAGNFSLNSDGYLVTPDGLRVQGWSTVDPATGLIENTGALGDIVIPPGVLRPPVATTAIGAQTNLNAGAAVNGTFTTSVQIYDAQGTKHNVTITYTKTAANAWNYSMTVPGADVVGGTAGTPFVLTSGSLTFDAQGKLSAYNVTAPATGGGTAPNIQDVNFTTPAWTSGAGANTLRFDLVDAAGVASLTGYNAASATSSVTQNGSGAGQVDSISITSDGTIVASFGAGQSVAVGQLAMANFNNPKGLVKLGGNRFGESAAAGLPNVGVAGTGGRGSLIGSAIEQSNVDIAKEFTAMILAQRGYQANSKSITTSDEMLIETLNLKR